MRRGRCADGGSGAERTAFRRHVGSSPIGQATALSFGQQRMIEIARTLIGEPENRSLDEPAVGLSPQHASPSSTHCLRRIRDRKGVTLIMIEHVIRLVMDVCDRVTVLNSGRVIADGPPTMPYATQKSSRPTLARNFDARRAAILASAYDRTEVLRDVSFTVPAARDRCAAGRQRVGQDHDPQHIDRACAAPWRARCSRWHRVRLACHPTRCAARHGAGAAGPRGLAQHERAWTISSSARRPSPIGRRSRLTSREMFELFPKLGRTRRHRRAAR